MAPTGLEYTPPSPGGPTLHLPGNGPRCALSPVLRTKSWPLPLALKLSTAATAAAFAPSVRRHSAAVLGCTCRDCGSGSRRVARDRTLMRALSVGQCSPPPVSSWQAHAVPVSSRLWASCGSQAHAAFSCAWYPRHLRFFCSHSKSMRYPALCGIAAPMPQHGTGGMLQAPAAQPNPRYPVSGPEPYVYATTLSTPSMFHAPSWVSVCRLQSHAPRSKILLSSPPLPRHHICADSLTLAEDDHVSSNDAPGSSSARPSPDHGRAQLSARRVVQHAPAPPPRRTLHRLRCSGSSLACNELPVRA